MKNKSYASKRALIKTKNDVSDNIVYEEHMSGPMEESILTESFYDVEKFKKYMKKKNSRH